MINITIAGELGSGKSTVANHLINNINYRIESAGLIFRRLAEQHGMTAKEFNQFIESNPKIGPIGSEPESHTNVPIIPETDISESIFTESLAKIYIKQKQYDKAKRIFEKLNLKFPEKNRYFADQIEKIDKLITNN